MTRDAPRCRRAIYPVPGLMLFFRAAPDGAVAAHGVIRESADRCPRGSGIRASAAPPVST